MIKTMVSVFLLGAVACAQGPGESEVQQGLCTAADQAAGLCSGPFGALLDQTWGYALAQPEVQNVPYIDGSCYMQSSGMTCSLLFGVVPLCGHLYVECHNVPAWNGNPSYVSCSISCHNL